MEDPNDGGFFSGIRQVDVWAAGEKARLPLFYRDASAHIAVFPANFFILKKLLPDPRFTPAQLLPGIGGVGIACFEYRDTDIGPYNESACFILLNNPHLLALPGYNPLRQLIQFNFYPYILHLPVTTEVALKWGVNFSGFPKFMADITFEDDGTWTVCRLKEGGEDILSMRTRKRAASACRIMKLLIRLYQDGQPQYTEFRINAKSIGVSMNPADVELAVGHGHRIADELSRMLIRSRAIMSFFIPRMEAILYGPEHLPLPLINYLLQEGMRFNLDQLKKTHRTD